MKAESTSPSTGCLVLAGLPFLASGGYTLFLLLRQWSTGSTDTEKALLLAIFTVLFGGGGLAIIFGGRWSARNKEEVSELRRLHPESPWMWRQDWAVGRARGANQKTVAVAWGFAGFWNLISLPLLLRVPEEFARSGKGVVLLALTFPLIGILLLVWAVRATLRYRKFGVSEVQLTTSPGVVGGRLRGSLVTRLQAMPEEVQVVLSSIRRVESRGSDSHSRERILWQDEYTLLPEHIQRGGARLGVPHRLRHSARLERDQR